MPKPLRENQCVEIMRMGNITALFDVFDAWIFLFIVLGHLTQDNGFTIETFLNC
jgi:hypothetical protein